MVDFSKYRSRFLVSIYIDMAFKKNILSIVFITAISATGHAAPIVSHSPVKEHFEEAGGEGFDMVTLKVPKTFTNQCATINSVKIDYIQRRYGKVVVEQKSIKACKAGPCKLRLNWKHAPAGRLSYRVKASWKQANCG